MVIKDVTTNTGISAQKMGRITSMIKGMYVEEALNILKFMPSPAAKKISKVVKSATNNAEEAVSSGSSNLIIKDIFANEGPRAKRFRARARGRMSRIIRRSSSITVYLDESEV